MNKSITRARCVAACCQEHNVSSSCIAVCAGGGVMNTRSCSQEFIKIIACAAGKCIDATQYDLVEY